MEKNAQAFDLLSTAAKYALNQWHTVQTHHDAIRIMRLMWNATFVRKAPTGTLLTTITRDRDTGHG